MMKQFSIILPVSVLAVCSASPALAQEPGQKTFQSSAEACHALFRAVQNNNEAALAAIIGKENISPDKEAAKLERHQFADKYEQMHRLVKEPEGTTVLYVGAENWPFPIPLMSKNGKWYFDAAAGKQEILYRKIGENEIRAQEVCDDFIAAQKQRRSQAAGDEMSQFAVKLAQSGTSGQQSFRGYDFRVVSLRAKSANSLALVAYPATYRVSGVTTFAVTGDGMVYEKDLGATTGQLAKQLSQRPADWNAVK